MASQTEIPVLTICIPIYNRIEYLERQLGRFLEDKYLFRNKIRLVISDNCSLQDLQSCCQRYIDQGLELFYHRNDRNIGASGNFEWCLSNANGKYVWLLGSDDIPQKGIIRRLIYYLENGDYGLIHLSQKSIGNDFIVLSSSERMVIESSFWLTFMSANIFRTESLKQIDISRYRETRLIQVPAYLNACCLYPQNAIMCSPQFFEKETDAANNGGYNLFQVFVTNLYGIYEEFMGKGLLSKQAFNKMIKIEYKEFLVGFIINMLILGRKGNFKTDGSWMILRKYYGNKPYAYYFLAKGFLKRCHSVILKLLIRP